MFRILTLCFLLPFFAQSQKKANVIYILTDQWRASSLGFNGDTIVKTPNLDFFAKSAVNFRNTVSVTPVCTPHRAALMTGRYPSTTGMFINDLYLPAEELCMAEIFSEAGYRTGYLGKWHLDGHGRENFVAPLRRQGWQDWKASECDHNHPKEHYYEGEDVAIKYWQGYSTYAIAAEARAYMAARAKNREPFFLFVSLSTPHFPHETAPEEYKKLYPQESLVLDKNVPEHWYKKVREELQGYYAHCTATDKAIGEIIDGAKSMGIYDDTIIVFTSDHGEMMGSHDFRPYMKHQPFSESSNVPFLISYPGIGRNAGKTAPAALTTPDILPSLLSMCGIDIPPTIEGYDLSHIMKSPELEADRAALYMNLCPFGIAYPSDEYRAIRTSRYTYVKNTNGPSMLFDNKEDEQQLNNLVNKEEFKAIQSKLDEQLHSELNRIGEKTIEPREYYLKKFKYYGKEQFRDTYHIDKIKNVKVVVSPNTSFSIANE